jgi:hypothetical protein
MGIDYKPYLDLSLGQPASSVEVEVEDNFHVWQVEAD